MDQSRYQRLAAHPQFAELVRVRTRFAVRLSLIMLTIYFGFILVIAFLPSLLARPLGEGMVMTIGIPVGIVVIVSAFVLTGIYARRANGEFDNMTKRLIRECP